MIDFLMGISVGVMLGAVFGALLWWFVDDGHRAHGCQNPICDISRRLSPYQHAELEAELLHRYLARNGEAIMTPHELREMHNNIENAAMFGKFKVEPFALPAREGHTIVTRNGKQFYRKLPMKRAEIMPSDDTA